MRVKVFQKIFVPILILSLFSQTALLLFPQKVNAQAGANIGGNVQTGFDVQGIAGSALVCSGVADQLGGLLNSLFSPSNLAPVSVPTKDPINDLRESCLKQITRTILNKILDKITLSTVNWINGGFAGSPLWLEDPGQFFGDIAKSEINAVTAWYPQDFNNYPFGQLVMGTILTNLQNQTQQNLRFSLNQVLAHGTYDEFRFNFNVGGWVGYSAFLEPQNNPFGNYLLVNNHIGRRISGTNVNAAFNFRDQLSQSGGFLSPRVCVVSATGNDDYIPEDNPLHLANFYQTLPAGSTLGDITFAQLPEAVQGELDDFQNLADQADAYNSLVLRSRCAQWRTTTPGNVVGTRLTSALDISTNSLLNADDFAENIGLIFDALLNQLVTAGLRGLSSDNQNSVLLAQVNGNQPGAVSNGQSNASGVDTVLGTGPTGVANLPILDVQNEYIQNAENALELLDELTKKIRALDYCVPGPNPRWITTATANFQQVLATAPAASNGLPTPENQTYYRNLINGMTGALINQSPAMYNHTQFLAFMQELFNRYQAKMLANYPLNTAPPTSRFFLTSLLNDLDVYLLEQADLTDYLANIGPLLPTIESLQQTLQSLSDANNGVLNPNDPQVQAQVSIFNSISNHLATQAQLDTLIERIPTYESEIIVLNGHLNSCVAETVVGPYSSPNSRMTYPSAIFPYPGLPGPNPTFLPGVSFGNSGNDVNIEINGVTVQFSSSGLSTFEALLQSVY